MKSNPQLLLFFSSWTLLSSALYPFPLLLNSSLFDGIIPFSLDYLFLSILASSILHLHSSFLCIEFLQFYVSISSTADFLPRNLHNFSIPFDLLQMHFEWVVLKNRVSQFAPVFILLYSLWVLVPLFLLHSLHNSWFILYLPGSVYGG